MIRVLDGHQPLTLNGLGELLVCETGTNPSRLVDRLVTAGAVARRPCEHDRREVEITLTPRGELLARDIAAIEDGLYRWLDTATAGRDPTRYSTSCGHWSRTCRPDRHSRAGPPCRAGPRRLAARDPASPALALLSPSRSRFRYLFEPVGFHLDVPLGATSCQQADDRSQ